MEINKEIIRILSEEDILDEGLLYLLSVYHNIKYDFNEIIVNKVNNLNFFEKNYDTNEIIWNINLYGDNITQDFIEQYRSLFIQIDTSLRGDRKTIIKKFKKFFLEYPQYSKQDILDAAKLYLEDCLYKGYHIKYIQNANYFIEKQRNPTGSKLLTYLEILKEEQ